MPLYASIPELIERARPDAVLVSTYCREMPDRMLQVARAGVHGYSILDAIKSSEIIEAAHEAGRSGNTILI